MCTVPILLAFCSIQFILGGVEAAGSCGATTKSCVCPCIPGLPGPPGPPSSITSGQIQQLRRELIEITCNNVLCKGTTEHCPSTSCKAIYEGDPTAPSGLYWIRNATGDAVQVFCQMNATGCGDVTGGWTRVAYIDMTDPEHTCPENLTYTAINSIRMCRSAHPPPSCASVIFPAHNLPYTKICGRARGYQFDSPDAFGHYLFHNDTTVDSFYADGLSITYGSPRNHVWTFAAGVSKDFDYSYCCNCPCESPYAGPAAPPYVGDNYFCESGNTGNFEGDSGISMTPHEIISHIIQS